MENQPHFSHLEAGYAGQSVDLRAKLADLLCSAERGAAGCGSLMVTFPNGRILTIKIARDQPWGM